MSHVIALLACHNRKNQTVACLKSLFEQHEPGCVIEAILVDDGSTDGTADAVHALFEKVRIIPGDGSLYWARAMALAEQQAITARPDYLLWLNDDVVLYSSALGTLMAAREPSTNGQIVVGSMVDPDTGLPTYGGADRIDWHPMRYRLVAPSSVEPQPATTFNGNVVLVPRPVYMRVGGIDGTFAHAYADFDYGLRARALGFTVVVAGTAVGICSHGPLNGRWPDPSLSLVSRYRVMLGRKGLPIGSYVRFLRRHGGFLWPVYVSATYLNVAVDHARRRRLRVRTPSQ